MNEQKKQKLLEQYDDAAFALLMDEYAEEEGARLMAEFEAAQAAGRVPEMPRELDEQCRRMIRRNSAKKRSKQAVRSFRKIAVKAAVAVLVFIGLMTTVVMSVEALRIPVLNFIVEHFGSYIVISPDDHPQSSESPLCVILEELLPPEYYQMRYAETDNTLVTVYSNEEGDSVQLLVMPESTEMNINVENANYSEIMLVGCNAILVEGDRHQVIWRNESDGKTYTFIASNLPLQLVLDICNALSTK